MKINDIKIEQGYNLLCTKLQNKSDEDTSAFGLLKLPIEVLYSEALKEIGAQESYIDELSYTINNLKTENMALNQKLELFEFINEEERLNMESDKNYLNKAASRNKLNKENKSLREDISTLICKLVACQKEISLLKQQLSAYQQAG
jgi:predicted RNase H-like nuclease (RuvC/YqgF family)